MTSRETDWPRLAKYPGGVTVINPRGFSLAYGSTSSARW